MTGGLPFVPAAVTDHGVDSAMKGSMVIFFYQNFISHLVGGGRNRGQKKSFHQL